MTSIAVTGASGKLGTSTLKFLLQRNVTPGNIIAVVRDPAKVSEFASRGVQVRRGDYTDVASLEQAFAGVDKLLFISTSALGEERMLHHGNVVKAAKAAGVKHIIYTSVIKPAPDAKFAASPGHYHTEVMIRDTGIPYTFFRNNLYLDILPMVFGGAVETGQIVHGAGDGKVGFIARNDIAEALAVVLTEGDHRNREYPITAVAPYSIYDVAAGFSKASGKTVTYKPVSVEDFRKHLESVGLPPPVVGISVALADAMRAGEFDAGSDQLSKLLGRAPVTLDAFLKSALAPGR